MNDENLSKIKAEQDEIAGRIADRIYSSLGVVTNTGIDDGGAHRRHMARILAANPEMSREDVFLQAIFERVRDVNA